MTEQRPVPRATYRLQLNKDFTFADAGKLAPYLAALGVSHAYLSPVLKARPGSTHGYDTVDHTMLNPELGSMADFRALAAELRAHGIGIVLDIVPNHMGIGGDENPMWLDVLEWGPRSRFADWFDINWSPSEPTLRNKLLVPFLGKPFGEALDAGALDVRFDRDAGSFAIWAEGTHRLPICPATYARVLGRRSERLLHLGNDFTAASDPCDGDRLKQRLAALCLRDDGLNAELVGCAAHLNSPDARGELRALIEQQHWRPARFSVAADDINYRRFFIVSDLAAIRIERDEVFDHVHKLVFELVAEGLVDGLRIDHIDGLYDPRAYCLKVREKCPKPIYLIVEKILAPHEALRPDWDVEGTTGYEFSGAVTRLLVDRDGEAEITRLYQHFTGDSLSLDDIERDAKLDIVDYEMAAELDALTTLLRGIALSDPATADLTRNALRNALRQVVSCMPVYRTYIDAGPLNAFDARNIAVAIAKAKALAPQLDPAVFDFLAAVMTAELSGARPRDADQVLDTARRIQQYTGPVMAKGLEDTALYRFNRLIALSDVGERPDCFSESAAAFHDFNAARQKQFPHCLLTTSSHDTKRGEDVRARLVVLSGYAGEWGSALGAWTELLRAGGEPVLDPADAWYFFQMMLGAWPADLTLGSPDTATRLAAFGERMQAAMLKSAREARLRTSWTVPNAGYEEALHKAIEAALSSSAFLESFLGFERRIGLAGAQNGLIAAALKLTLPGVPDIYQGAELWEQSMVDPDNRRPVDFELRRSLLERAGEVADLSALIDTWRDGAVKIGLISRLLALRASHPDLFALGAYEPIAVTGADADRVVAFARAGGGERMVVIAALGSWRGAPDAGLVLPAPEAGRSWHDVLRGRPLTATGSTRVSDLIDALPVAVLTGNRS